MNHTLSDSQLEAMVKSAVNSFGPLPPDEKFSQLISALRELQERRKAVEDKDLQGVIGALEHPAGINAAGKQVVRRALEELQDRRKAESEPVAWMVIDIDTGERIIRCDRSCFEGPCTPLYRHAQPAPARDRVRCEHAEWSHATFGNVGPVGPLKHLSKEALEAAAEPGDLSEWADMQFLMWDAQRRAGITDEQITQAMIEKLVVNKQRSWPEPKEGEPRLHIKEQPAPVVPEKATVGEMPFLGTSEGVYVRGWNDCRAAMLQCAENTESRCSIQTAPALDSFKENADARCSNSPVILDGSTAGMFNSARALLDALYEFGPDEIAISEHVTNLEDALRNAAAPQEVPDGK
ncbi:DUF550 domain-containing protein [Klebsiella grimontii]|uniref:DUF550 domain-containing protein n=1 Tax=Klebsiella grimontii TaxID=2058152 RepID=UPI003F5D5573